ncbi:YdaS family helix-turn-helix protein [Accumulibacter sp.]|uniref:YdaS family helix-turn-helix protein n=2 Tax=Accumulibacter sp. TaxID=2053492 RepID=UPI00339065A1
MCTLRSAIASMGGPSKVARDYGFSVQQVCNWAVRGVPARVILDNESFAQALYQAGYERKKQAA